MTMSCRMLRGLLHHYQANGSCRRYHAVISRCNSVKWLKIGMCFNVTGDSVLRKSSRTVICAQYCDKQTFEDKFTDEHDFQQLMRDINNDFHKSIEKELLKIELEQKRVQMSAERADGDFYYYDSDLVDPKQDDLVEVNILDQEIMALRHKRGEFGVFDIGDLVYSLERARCEDVCVIRPSADVDYLVIATARSARHVRAVRETLVKEYKSRRGARDRHVTPLGARNTKWVSVDMGSIVLHIMEAAVREKYDLESLWTVGSAYDDQYEAAVGAAAAQGSEVSGEEMGGGVMADVLEKYKHVISDELRDKLMGAKK